MRSPRHLTLAITASAALLAACGVDPADSAVVNTTPVSTTAVSTPVSTPVSDPASNGTTGSTNDALAFTAPLVGGGTFDGAGYAGAPLALWFWAPT